MTLDHVSVEVGFGHESLLCSRSVSWFQEEENARWEALDESLVGPRPPDGVPLREISCRTEDQSEEKEVWVSAGAGVGYCIILGYVFLNNAQVQFPGFLPHVDNRAIRVNSGAGLQEVLLDKVSPKQQRMEEKHVEEKETPLVGAQPAQSALEDDRERELQTWLQLTINKELTRYLHDWSDNSLVSFCF